MPSTISSQKNLEKRLTWIETGPLKGCGGPFQVLLMTSGSCGHSLACIWLSLCTVQDSPLIRPLQCPKSPFLEGYSHPGLESTLIASFLPSGKTLFSNKVVCMFLRAWLQHLLERCYSIHRKRHSVASLSPVAFIKTQSHWTTWVKQS